MNNMQLNEELDEIFQDIRNHLDQMDSIRENVLPLQRKIVRNCSEIIKKIHRREFDSIEEKIAMTMEDLIQMKRLIDDAPGDFPADYLQIAQQEFGEATIFYNLIVKEQTVTPQEINIDLLEYAYALADVVGELRRYVMSCLREDDLDNANKGFESMNVIYDHLFTLDYPNGLVPGLRNKIDQARGILAKTEGDLVVITKMLRLNRNLEKFDNESDKEKLLPKTNNQLNED
jgi:translin